MAKPLKVYYFNAEDGWWVGIKRIEENGSDGVIVTDPIKEEADAKAIAEHIGQDLDLPVEKLEVLLSHIGGPRIIPQVH